MVRRGRDMRSPPLERRLGFALLPHPLARVGDGELQVLAEVVGARAQPAGAPVVDGRDGDAKVLRQLGDVDHGLEAEGQVLGGVVGFHAQQVPVAPPRIGGDPCCLAGFGASTPETAVERVL